MNSTKRMSGMYWNSSVGSGDRDMLFGNQFRHMFPVPRIPVLSVEFLMHACYGLVLGWVRHVLTYALYIYFSSKHLHALRFAPHNGLGNLSVRFVAPHEIWVLG